MKLSKSKAGNIAPNNAGAVVGVADMPFDNTQYYYLCLVIATMFDEIASGKNMYMIVGATSTRDAFTLTIKEDNAPTAFYGSSLEELSTKVQDVL